MAVISECEEAKAASPEAESKPYRHDHALSELLKEHGEQPLELLETLIEFLFRRTDLARDAGAQSKVAAVVAAVQKKGCVGDGDEDGDGDNVAAAMADVGETNKGSASPKSEEEPCGHISPSSVPEKSPAGLKPNLGNGFDHGKYSWTQTLGEVSVHVYLPKGTKGREVACEIKNKTLKAGLKGQKPILEGELYKLVMADACFWTLEDDGTLSIFLTKCNRLEWWKSVVRGEPEIDTARVDPEISKLHDLDSDTRGTVEKLMFDQRQRKLGLPTSNELSKKEVLKKFMAEHPNMDFSNVNVN